VWLLPGPGSPDVTSWKVWTFVGSSDPAGLYGVGGSPPERRVLDWHGTLASTEYPPLALYEMAAVGWIYRNLNPAYPDSTTLTMLVKAPGIVAEIALVWSLLTGGRRVFGDAAAVWTALTFWLHPAVLLNGAGLGYLDAEAAVPATLALIAALSGRGWLAGLLAAAGLVTKAQVLFVLPAIALALLVRRGAMDLRPLWRATASGVAFVVAVATPIAVHGAWSNMLQALGRLAAHNMVSGYALNIWWIITWITRVIDERSHGLLQALAVEVRILQVSAFTAFVGFNPKPVGTVLVIAALLWGIWTMRRTRDFAALALFGGWCVSVYAMFGIQVHENHGYLAVPFLLLAAGLRPEWRSICWAATLMTAVNMYLIYGIGNDAPPIVDRRWTWIDLTVIFSVINVWIVWRLTKQLTTQQVDNSATEPLRH